MGRKASDKPRAERDRERRQRQRAVGIITLHVRVHPKASAALERLRGSAWGATNTDVINNLLISAAEAE